ncbi:hypothetical protein [Geothrix sp.]|uniref:hypothetical protein n=1 Tax=Geothrix sp. TaxID=1962974 RepID=UPI0025BA5809|nr:hypothetical protein [Geothrix sp.]
MGKIDFKHIAREALDQSLPLLMEFLPGGRIQGQEYIVRNPTRKDRRAGSFSINLMTGRWCEFATGERGGDLISLVAYIKVLPQGEAARELARMMWGKNAAH